MILQKPVRFRHNDINMLEGIESREKSRNNWRCSRGWKGLPTPGYFRNGV